MILLFIVFIIGIFIIIRKQCHPTEVLVQHNNYIYFKANLFFTSYNIAVIIIMVKKVKKSLKLLKSTIVSIKKKLYAVSQ